MRCLILFLCCSICSAADWPAYEGGAAKHNASPDAIEGTTLLWQRSFPSFKHAAVARREGSGYASRNLVTHGDSIAIIGIAADEGIDEQQRDHYAQLSILNRHSGKTQGVFKTRARSGSNSVSRGSLPTGYFGNAVDVPGFFQALHWDSNGHLFICAGGDSPAMSGLAPLPALAEWESGRLLPIPGAFTSVDKDMTNYKGKTRQNVASPLAKFPGAKDTERIGLGTDWLEFDGSNRPSFFAVDPGGEFIAHQSGGHSQGGRVFLLNKESGLRVFNPYKNSLGTTFAMRDPLMLVNNILYYIGPVQDADNSGKLGDINGAGTTRPKHGKNGTYQFARNSPGGPDQGLRIHAERLVTEDNKIAKTESLFSYDFKSTHLPRRGLHDAYSYVETDGLQRDKSMILDGDRLWVAWKPSLNGPVALCWADPQGSGSIDLNVGHGIRGQSIWPRMSLATVNNKKHIVYCLANAHERAYLHEAYPWSAAKGSWAAERTAPTGPSQLAVVDIENKQLRWTANLTEAHPSLPINDYWLSADRVQMLVAGDKAWIAWIDLSQEQAALALAAYDISADKAQHSVTTIPLDFKSATAKKSYCTDLIAVDGTLYALVTQSDTMWPGAPSKVHYNWDAQHLIAIGKP